LLHGAKARAVAQLARSAEPVQGQDLGDALAKAGLAIDQVVAL
jgi:hypothetical protein